MVDFIPCAGAGLYWVIPLVNQKIRVGIRTRTVDIEAQETVTSDSVTIRVNAVLYYRITEPERAVIAVADYEAATYQIALTTLRNVIGQHFLDEVLKDRNKINKAVRPVVDDVTDPWGLSVEPVEIKDVEIPGAMRRAHGQRGGGGPGEACSIDQSRSGTEASMKLAGKRRGRSPSTRLRLNFGESEMVAEVGVEQNTTTILMLPSDFVTLARTLTTKLRDDPNADEHSAEQSEEREPE